MPIEESNVIVLEHVHIIMFLVSSVKLNLPKMMEQKEKAVNSLTKGIDVLFKKNKVSKQTQLAPSTLLILLRLLDLSVMAKLYHPIVLKLVDLEAKMK